MNIQGELKIQTNQKGPVLWNKDYNPVAGNRIENITFRNITYNVIQREGRLMIYESTII
ncbi:hypothetical protein [Cohnella sp.]|uniref:hypothetical protein n=1 Tax=Cohnella sp. TaxID=1883426 RepID=UPI0035679ECC